MSGPAVRLIVYRYLLPSTALLSALAATPSLARGQTPSPALVVAVRGARELAVIDPMTNKVVGSIAVGHLAHEVAVSDDGTLAFVTTNNRGDPKQTAEVVPDNDFISVVDLVGQKEVRRVDTGRGSFPHGIHFAGGKVYYTDQGYDAIARYDPTTNEIDWMMGTGQSRSHMMVITKDAKRMFTANTFSNSVTAVTPWDAAPGSQKYVPENFPAFKITQISVDAAPEGIALSPDEKEVWVLSRGTDNASIIDVSSNKVVQTLQLNAGIPLRLAFTPDGKRVLVVTELSGDVIVLDSATRKEIKRISVGKMQPIQVVNGVTLRNGAQVKPEYEMHGLLITPDGSRAYVGLINLNYIDVIDLNTYEIIGRIDTGNQPESLAWAERK